MLIISYKSAITLYRNIYFLKYFLLFLIVFVYILLITGFFLFIIWYLYVSIYKDSFQNIAGSLEPKFYSRPFKISYQDFLLLRLYPCFCVSVPVSFPAVPLKNFRPKEKPVRRANRDLKIYCSMKGGSETEKLAAAKMEK